MARNLKHYMVFKSFVDAGLRAQIATPRSQLAALTLAALAVAWFWALPPILTPLLYITPSNWTDADLVRHLWHFRLVQPEWVGSPPQYDYLRWAQAETLARLGVMVLGWFSGTAWVIRRHLGRRRVATANPAASGNGATAYRYAALRLKHLE